MLWSGSVRGKTSQERWLTRRYLKLQAAGGWSPCRLGESQRCPDLSVFTYCEWMTWWYTVQRPCHSLALLQSLNKSTTTANNVKTIHQSQLRKWLGRYITTSVIVFSFLLRRYPLCSGICSKFFPSLVPAGASLFPPPASIFSNFIFLLHIIYTLPRHSLYL